MTGDHTARLDPESLREVLHLQQSGIGECSTVPAAADGGTFPTVLSVEKSGPRKIKSPAPHKKGSRLLVLDGLRALAICLVMLHHYSQNMAKSGFGDHFFFGFANSCWLGVDLFFVLSGFLITGILYDAKGSPSYFRTFYIRRSLRIFPIYYVLLFVVLVILPALHHSIVDEFTLRHSKWFWLYGANYLSALVNWPSEGLAHLWSLAIEEHFYIVWPIVVFCASKRQLLIGGTVFILLAIVMHFYAAIHGASPTALYVSTHFRIGSLVMGGLLAMSWRTPAIWSLISRHAGKAALGLLVLGSLGLTDSIGLDWRCWSAAQFGVGFVVISLFFAAVHVLCLNLPEGTLFYRILGSAPALWLGRLSYGMYLFHRPLEMVAINLGLHPSNHVVAGFPSWPYVTAYAAGNAAATALLAWLTWNLFEKHILRMKDRFVYQKDRERAVPVPDAVRTADIEPMK